MIKRLWFILPLALMGSAMGTTSNVSAATDAIIPISDDNNLPEIGTQDGDVTSNPYFTPPVKDATGTHSTFTTVSSHTTKHKFLKAISGYAKGPATVSFGKGESFSGSASASYGAGSASFNFSGTTTITYSFPVPSGRLGAVGYYADVKATRFLVKPDRNMNNALLSTSYASNVVLSDQYDGLRLK
ncbi:hypothetical protein [Lacticaseibacillus absianus]|uniref:hypothetical protein n=1 Tax=Lacticaseibacillus absianus TaxID=2729623 RepID=UPI0015CCE79B|nr:hypothetical protein [Lacticaseibacillus absianus]